jgi:DNA (cytosine-5)-methyltransferase 1
LEEYHTHGQHDGLFYRVVVRLLNAADYGVPQKRERVIIVGFRSDIEREWSFPKPTHSEDILVRDQWVTGDYWERHEVAKSDRPVPPPRLSQRIRRLRADLIPPPDLPWKTVRDALIGLPDPSLVSSSDFQNHVFNAGARTYHGHTGSPIDEPAKTLKAGDHGVPGGENVLTYPDGRVRYFTVRESARLQTFPDQYTVAGSWTEAMRQLGNAVPVTLARVVADGIAASLSQARA